MGPSCCRYVLLLAVLAICQSGPLRAQAAGEVQPQYDADRSLAKSQAALGTRLENLRFTGSNGQQVQLADFRGRPLLISLVFTSCYHVCPAITRHLANAAEAARDALGEDSFQLLTVGFDTPNDTPEAMRVFAQQQKIDDPNWAFVSADAHTISQLVSAVGFDYFPSPRGFDHINQVTMVDREGVIYRQVYGGAFELPALVEPLKELVFNRPAAQTHFAAGLVDRIMLFCTVYDPSTGRYRFDYSLFVQIAVGALAILGIGSWLVMEAVRSRRRKQSSN
jgi:protein SCO1/2